MSGSTKTVSDNKSTQTNTTDPAQMGMLTNNYTGAQSALSAPTTYQGDMTAGFNPTQTQAQGVLTGIANDPRYAAANNNAVGAVQGVLGNTPNPTITAPTVAASTYDPSQLSGVDLSKYENPYTANVINASVAQNERARQTAQTNDSQQATASNAFGGSRSGVMAALTNGQYDQNDQTNIANLNDANFKQAQAAAAGDVAAQNQSKQYNATNTQNAGIFNSTANTNAQQSTFANKLAAQGLQINAAGQLVSLNNAALGTATQQGGILSAVGDAQQAQQQAALTSAYQNWAAGKQLSIQEQQLLNQTIGLFPNQQTVSSTGSGTSDVTKTPGLTDIIGALGSAAGGAGAMGLKLSDGRAKSDVCTIRHDARGRRWVSFRYNWEPEGTRHEGVIAQEILKSDPHAVHMSADGFYRVNYDALTEDA